VIIGDGEAVGTNEKSRADRGLPSRPGNDRSNLQQPRWRGGKDPRARRRSGSRRLAGNGESHAGRHESGEPTGCAQKLPHGRPFSPSSAGWEGSLRPGGREVISCLASPLLISVLRDVAGGAVVFVGQELARHEIG